ncbi:MAG: hypothetical protein E4H14_13485 [Candidatus Thorarchaeota archaeon]|nr:MAG: hypothetical protein E4H14_13485 [Candidatus Thorarchaeota archaeon]
MTNHRSIGFVIVFLVIMLGVGTTSLSFMGVPTNSYLQSNSGTTIVIGTTDSVDYTLDMAKS